MLDLKHLTSSVVILSLVASNAHAEEPADHSARPVTFSSDPVDSNEPPPPPAQSAPPAVPPPPTQYAAAPAPAAYAPQPSEGYVTGEYVREPPATLPYRPGPVPQGYYVEESTRPGLWIPGIAVFGGAYALSVLSARPSENNGTSGLYAPIVGPWITIAECTNCDDAVYSLLAFDGLAQAGGLALFILGLSLTKKSFVREYEEYYSVLPRRFGADGYGVSVQGAF